MAAISAYDPRPKLKALGLDVLPGVVCGMPGVQGRGSDGQTIIRFGAFEVDLAAGEPRKNGLKIRLRNQTKYGLGRPCALEFQSEAMLLQVQISETTLIFCPGINGP